MTAFEYLAAFISIVTGLGVAQTLSGVARLVNGRRTMRVDLAHLLWTAGLLVWLVNFWWFSFSLTQLQVWRIGTLFFVVLYPAVVYFLLALLHPRDTAADFDAQAHLESNRGWFFGGLFVLGVVELLDAWTKESSGLLDPVGFMGPTLWYPAFMLCWLAGSIFAMRSAHRGFNVAFALAFVLGAIALAVANPPLEAWTPQVPR